MSSIRTDLEPILNTLFAKTFPTIARTPAKGTVHAWPPVPSSWMAHPACPFPYGTIIKPTKANDENEAEARHMVVGFVPRTDYHAVMTVNLRTVDRANRFHAQLRETMTEYWEAAE